ncbi:acyl-CoA synthetase [Micromonospora gifhornensis]|uniref:Long-chain acyl-CoA synthetase n=1 Tax=Micromonospora gifhornensis TaxID=84594 RepID=A0ABQ4IJS3_9ACTN|nr:AMP-binding protein [Micromonospora gifhornensis]GIJ18163.1 long-chain acyl-CoA synthetase [Micromonospora gifhornensis]
MPPHHDPPALLAARITATPDAPALADEGGVLTWAHLGERVNRWRALLTSSGVSSGDAVALMLGNRREALEALLACLHAGITVVPVNWHLTAPEVAYLLADADARLLVVDPPRAEVGAKAAAEAGTVTALVTGDEVAYGLAAVEPLLAATDPSAAPAEQECGQLMIYTSGTTGRPKGVLNGLFVTGAPWARATRLLAYATGTLGVPTDGRVLLVGPWYHSAQLFFALLPLLNGATLVVRERFDPAGTLSTMDAERITECHLVPTQFVRLLRLDPAVRAGFSGASLRRIWHGGGPCPPDVKRRMIEWWGPVLVEYYAATEGGVVTLIDSADWLNHPGSVGRPVPPNQILVVDDDGRELGPYQPGRIFIRRPGRGFRYHNAAEKTRAAHLAPGVFTYGEVGHLDDDGYLYLTGRAQNMIVSGGVNVYPAEIEQVLLQHPDVRDAVVLGVPDEEYGERVAAVVEWEPGGRQLPWSALDAHCRQHLAGFKVPRCWRTVGAVPREPTGKLRLDQLRTLCGDDRWER